jgi:hypothetical protein
LNNAISAHLLAKGSTQSTQPATAKTNNLNIVVSGIDSSGHATGIVNGQLVTLPGNLSFDVLNSLSANKQLFTSTTVASSKAKVGPPQSAPGKIMQLSRQPLQLEITGSSGKIGSSQPMLAAALPTGTVLMDTRNNMTGQSAFLSSSHVTLSSSNGNALNNNSTGIVLRKVSPKFNGLM